VLHCPDFPGFSHNFISMGEKVHKLGGGGWALALVATRNGKLIGEKVLSFWRNFLFHNTID
jgi:hypothetical protein